MSNGSDFMKLMNRAGRNYSGPSPRWSYEYVPFRPMRSPFGFGGPGAGGPGSGGNPGGGGTPGGGGNNGGGTGNPPGLPWQYPTMLNPPFGLGPDWRATMNQYVLPFLNR